jgi:uncharacterized damage-inducible protein DinB
MMMNKLFAVVVFGSSVAMPVVAQQGQPPPATVAAYLRNAYTNGKNNILRSAEKTPEEFYGLRPGPQEEVRTFGQHVAHVATYNFLWCSQAKGEKNPNAGNSLEKTLKTKAEFIKAASDAFAYCDPVYAALTDASGMEIIDITQESGRQTKLPRMALLIMNLSHNSEIYGNLVTTMRMKSIVPPSSEPRRPQQ